MFPNLLKKYALFVGGQAEKQRELDIQEYGKEVQTKGYIENMAREKLGLVYEDEILLKQEN